MKRLQIDDARTTVLELRDLVLKWCGSPQKRVYTQDVEDYAGLREQVIANFGSEYVPHFIQTYETLTSFRDFARQLDPDLANIRSYVRNEFNGLLGNLKEARAAPRRPAAGRDPHAPSATRPNSGVSTSARSSDWTGIRTVKEQALVVRNFGPIAMQALEQVIAVYENRLHNRPPDPLEPEVLQALRDLHAELGRLLGAIDESRVSRSMTAVSKAAAGAFQYSKNAGTLLISGLPALGAAILPSLAVIKALDIIYGESTLSADGGAAVVAGITGGYMAISGRKS